VFEYDDLTQTPMVQLHLIDSASGKAIREMSKTLVAVRNCEKAIKC